MLIQLPKLIIQSDHIETVKEVLTGSTADTLPEILVTFVSGQELTLKGDPATFLLEWHTNQVITANNFAPGLTIEGDPIP